MTRRSLNDDNGVVLCVLCTFKSRRLLYNTQLVTKEKKKNRTLSLAVRVVPNLDSFEMLGITLTVGRVALRFFKEFSLTMM